MIREPAKRVSAQELTETDYTFKEGDGEYAPNLLQLLGGIANRIFLCGVATSIDINEMEGNTDHVTLRVKDGTGTALIMAGKYQTDAAHQIKNLQIPETVGVIGKVDTFEGDEDTVTYIKPEIVIPVDKNTVDTWTIEMANQTLDRIRTGEERDGVNYLTKAKNRYNNYNEKTKRVKDSIIEALENLE